MLLQPNDGDTGRRRGKRSDPNASYEGLRYVSYFYLAKYLRYIIYGLYDIPFMMYRIRNQNNMLQLATVVIFSEHFSLNTFSIDKRTHSYIKNVTEQCIIHHADLDLTNTICHNVFTCKEDKCALPFPTEEVIRQACSRLDFNYEKCNDLNQESCLIMIVYGDRTITIDDLMITIVLNNYERIFSMILPMPNKFS